MKNNHLVMIDWIIGLGINPIIFFIKILKICLSKIYNPKRNGYLIIKFLGAGNYIAINSCINSNVDLVSAISNKNTIEYFLKPKNIYYINDNNFLLLVITSIKTIILLFLRSYECVINLEAESTFAKFIAITVRSNKIVGLTNKHRSYLDYILYDKYFVNPLMINKSEIIDLLINYKIKKNNHVISAVNNSKTFFINNLRSNNYVFSNIIFSPAGSDTNNLRRLKSQTWELIYNKIIDINPNCNINILFPSKDDIQYDSLVNLFPKSSSLTFTIGDYHNYVESIKFADLVFCIDSQTLHIANEFKKPVVCFYGPTSPYGVNYSKFIYPVSKAAMCSPCMHKYFIAPCNNSAFCMDFDSSDLEFINDIL